MTPASESPTRAAAPNAPVGGRAPRLELRGITKVYPNVVANQAISLRVEPGEIHAVLGENGAGKSTLMKVIYGAVRPDAGEMLFDGRPVVVRSPRDARALGIAMVFQHFSLFDSLSVAQNVWLGLDKATTLPELTQRIRDVASTYGLDIDPTRPVHALSVGERQRVEIIRALLTKPKLLILDEPTSVLTPQAVERLFGTLRRLADEGCAILYISHKLDEIRALCHRCTVLRAGQVTGEVVPADETTASLSTLMVGAEPPKVWHRPARVGATALRVRHLALAPQDEHDTPLRHVHLQVRAGEILGLAGVSGNGQQALLRVLSGEDRRAPPGSVRLFEADITRASPPQRRALGLRVVPEERLERGAVPAMSLEENTLLTRAEPRRSFGRIDLSLRRLMTARFMQRLGVRAAGPTALAGSLSGGNLQKYIVGREIDALPRVLVVAQPTWGVDVGAASVIRHELMTFRDAGCALLVISEELDELFELADRLQVIAGGRTSPSLPIEDASVALIGEWMSGLWPSNEAEGGAPSTVFDSAPLVVEGGDAA